MATNIYEFKWKVYEPKFPGCANDGTERYFAKCFDDAYNKLDWEVFAANRVMSDVR